VIREHSFYLFDIKRCNWERILIPINYGKKGQLIFGNALYFKKLMILDKQLKNQTI
jgi:hypothetical protein